MVDAVAVLGYQFLAYNSPRFIFPRAMREPSAHHELVAIALADYANLPTTKHGDLHRQSIQIVNSLGIPICTPADNFWQEIGKEPTSTISVPARHWNAKAICYDEHFLRRSQLGL
jgi:hypothetical protein